MPKLSDTMTTGTLVKWLKKEGETVASGMMIAEIETDKATMELESFEDGVLLKQVAAVGAQVAVGAPICVIGKKDEDISGLDIGSKAAPEEKEEEKESDDEETKKSEDEESEAEDSGEEKESDESDEKKEKEGKEEKKEPKKKEDYS
jgi:pyruvate dehydrogenase E2 component (dihydrolipoamide acetyltransferase)